MAKSENQKLKLLYIRKYLLEHTDKDHRVTTAGVCRRVSLFSVECKKRTEERVKLLCDNALAGVILDRFGTTIYVKLILHN